MGCNWIDLRDNLPSSITLELNPDNSYCCIGYVDLKDNRTFKITIPRLKLDINEPITISNICYEIFNLEIPMSLYIDLNSRENIFFEDVTEYHEMTVYEIEQELGYKIKIKK